MLDLSIIILTFNTKEITLNCLKSIYRSKVKLNFDVWVLDNGSSDGTFEEIVKKYPKVNVQKSENLGFVGGNNLILEKIYKKSRYCLLLNSDTLVNSESLINLVSFSDRLNAGIVSCKLLNSDNTFQPNAGDLPKPLPLFMWISQLDGILGHGPSFHQKRKNYYTNAKEVGWVSGAAMLIHQEVFEKIGFLDQKIFMYGEDVEYCFRAKKHGFRVMWTNEAEIIHIGGASSKIPKYNQWRGEFLGLIYLYRKYYDGIGVLFVKTLIYLFSLLRIIAFGLFGKFEYSKTYAKIVISI